MSHLASRMRVPQRVVRPLGRGPNLQRRSDVTKRICSEPGCGRPHAARGYCSVHYMRWRKAGGQIIHPLPLENRFWPKVQRGTDEECWPWLAAKDGHGYGHFYDNRVKTSVKAHRIAYELQVGPIPDGLQIDHLCRNPLCQNAAHLEPVSMQENIRRSPLSAQNRTHCPKGHPYDEENTGWTRHGKRCLTCHRERERERARRKR